MSIGPVLWDIRRCYCWVVFCNTVVSFPQSPWVLGRYSGPSGDLGPAMGANFLKSNGQIVLRYTFRAITKTELNIPEGKTERASFDISVQEKFGDETRYEDYKDEPDYDTPFFGMYKDYLSSEATRLPEYDEADVEQYDLYVNAKVLLDHDNAQLVGVVKGRNQERYGTLHIEANSSPILDTRVYDVSFPNGTEK